MVPPHKNVLCTSSIVFKKKILNYSLFYVTIAWNSALLGSKVFFLIRFNLFNIQLRPYKQSKEHSLGSSEIPNYNIRQISSWFSGL